MQPIITIAVSLLVSVAATVGIGLLLSWLTGQLLFVSCMESLGAIAILTVVFVYRETHNPSFMG